MFEAYNQNDEAWLRKFRIIAYEVWRKGAKHPPGIDSYMPIGKIDTQEKTVEELDDIWEKYGKKATKKFKKLSKLMKN